MSWIGGVLKDVFSFLLGLLPASFVQTFMNTYAEDIVIFKEYAGAVAYILPISDLVDMTKIWAGVMAGIFVFFALKNRI